MGKQAPASARMPSQRAPAEVRRAEAAKTEAERTLAVTSRENAETMSQAAYWCKQASEKDKIIAELRGPTLEGCKSTVPKLKDGSSAFYDHVDFLYKVLKRFDTTDVPLLDCCASIKYEHHSDGTKSRQQAHDLICMPGDGAGLTARDSGVRIASFPGSTNYLAQSQATML